MRIIKINKWHLTTKYIMFMSIFLFPIASYSEVNERKIDPKAEVTTDKLKATEENQSQNSLKDAILGGHPIIDLRYRYEWVDQANFNDNANASTLRTRLGYETGKFYDFQALMTFENLTSIGPQNYDSTVNGNKQYPVVADPTVTQVDQVYISYSGIPDTQARAGRQVIKLDNDRFIGNVGWRQIQQTFDAVRIVNKTIDKTTFDAGYMWNVNTIFGINSTKSQLKTNNYFANVAYDGLGFGKIIGYTYFLDFINNPTLSTNTFGGRFVGKHTLKNLDNFQLTYTAEYARQESATNNPNSYGVNYFSLVPGVSYKGVIFKLGLEYLGGNGKNAFSTPLATLWKFNGWADKFLKTPVNGLDDRYVLLGYKFNDIPYMDGTFLRVIYHSFRATETSAIYGSEWDVGITKSFLKNYAVGFFFASYTANSFAQDTNKLWSQISMKF